MTSKVFSASFYHQDALALAPALLGQYLIRRLPDGQTKYYTLSETEAYRGEADKGCHCSRGRTKRTEMMYHEGGRLYIYLIYGMHWMLNIVSGPEGHPQAVLIRGLREVSGPGRLTKKLQIDKTWHGKPLSQTSGLWIASSGIEPAYSQHPRIGIDYAGNYWAARPWRYILKT